MMAIERSNSKACSSLDILSEVKKASGRKVHISTVHTVLRRLEERSLVKSMLKEASCMRRGKRQRYFELTPLGKQAFY